MATLTCAELARYPGANPTEQALAHHAERIPRAKALTPAPAASTTRSSAPRAKVLAAHGARTSGGAVSLPRVLDLRPFPGRDRVERVMAWLVAHTPRASTWSVESLRELSERIAATGHFVE